MMARGTGEVDCVCVSLAGWEFLGQLIINLSVLIHEMGITDLREMVYVKQMVQFA